jgi:beta-glucosidase
MSKRHLILCAVLSAASLAHAKVTSPYDHVAIVTNTINWPYDSKTYGNNSFQLGGDENTDTMILKEAQEKGLHFPADFEFGVACSAYQYEGNRVAPEGSGHGTGWSMWDVYSEKNSWLNPRRDNPTQPYNIAEIAPTSNETVPNGSKAIEGFYKYKEDIQKVKDLGVTTYRLSISWPRLFPRPGMKIDDVNQEGIAYYTAVLKEAQRQGLTPLVTLYHWDMPAWLYNFGDKNIADKDKTYGWLDMRDAQENLALIEFQKYAAAVYQHFGQFTSHFSTFNEPLTFTNNAYVNGNQAPGKNGFEHLWKKNSQLYGWDMNSSIERVPYLQAINIIKAHDIAYRTIHAIYKDKGVKSGFKEPKVSIVLNSDWAEPFRINCDEQGNNCSYNKQDIEASGRQMDYMLGWWLNPVMFGSWPANMDNVYNNKERINIKLSQFIDNSCLQKDGKPVQCNPEDSTQISLTDDIKAGGTLDELSINHYTGYFVVDMNYAKANFGDDPTKNKVPPNQYNGNPTNLSPGWDSDQNAFTTQFRYLKYGDTGSLPAATLNPTSKRAYVIGSAGAQPWLRQTWFVYRKLMQYINAFYLQSQPKSVKVDRTKRGVNFSKLAIYLTENGTSIQGESQKETNDPKDKLMDLNRIQYLVGNLGALRQAKVDDGINIKLYTYWSIADNFEWGEGYDSRFGLLWIDYTTLARQEKQSYKCYQRIINNKESNSFPKEACPLVFK